MQQLSDSTRVLRFPSISEVLRSPLLRPAFQPIAFLDQASETPVHGFESLARFGGDSPFMVPNILFSYAERVERVAELDLLLIGRSIEASQLLPSASTVFINVHPSLLCLPELLIPGVVLGAERNGLALDRLVIEVTEQAAIPDRRQAMVTFSELRSAGVRFALDDVGVAYSHLLLIDQIQPSYLKISQDFGTAFETDFTKRRIVRNIYRLGCDFGLQVILEGIESKETADAAREIGIPLGQGFYYGRPEQIVVPLESVA